MIKREGVIRREYNVKTRWRQNSNDEIDSLSFSRSHVSFFLSFFGFFFEKTKNAIIIGCNDVFFFLKICSFMFF